MWDCHKHSHTTTDFFFTETRNLYLSHIIRKTIRCELPKIFNICHNLSLAKWRQKILPIFPEFLPDDNKSVNNKWQKKSLDIPVSDFHPVEEAREEKKTAAHQSNSPMLTPLKKSHLRKLKPVKTRINPSWFCVPDENNEINNRGKLPFLTLYPNWNQLTTNLYQSSFIIPKRIGQSTYMEPESNKLKKFNKPKQTNEQKRTKQKRVRNGRRPAHTHSFKVLWGRSDDRSSTSPHSVVLIWLGWGKKVKRSGGVKW